MGICKSKTRATGDEHGFLNFNAKFIMGDEPIRIKCRPESKVFKAESR